MVTFRSFVLLLCAIFISFFTADVSFAQSVVKKGVVPEKITDGYQFTEGPFWHPDGYLLFSDIPANTIYKWQPDSTSVLVFLTPSDHSNGITMDKKRRLILSQHDGKISAIVDDSVIVLASSYQGKRLNSPNDAAVKSDGTVYFTDPPYGVSDEDRELDISGVYRIAEDGQVELLYDGFSGPNGIVFSPDENTLYVNNLPDGRIVSFDMTSDGNVSLPLEFANVGKRDNTGAADGMVVDTSGRLYSTGPGGIYVFSREGKQLEKIPLAFRATNLEWGKAGSQELFISSPSAIYRLQMNAEGRKERKK